MRRALDPRWATRGPGPDAAPRRTWPLAVLMMAVLMVPVEGASSLPQPDGTTLALRLARALGAERADAAPTYDATLASEAAPWWQRTVHDADRDGMFDQLDRLVDSGSREPVDVLVDVDRTPAEADAAALASRVAAEGWGLFPVLQVVGLRAVPPSMLPTLARLPGVLMLEPRMVPVPLMDVATRAIKARESDVYGPENAWSLGAKGDGVNIAIMDTGVDDSHPALVGKWVAGADFTNPKWLPIRGKRDGTWNADDAAGHGTTCAGIAMGTGAPDGTYIGAAPDARLVDLRIGTPLGFSPGEGPQGFYDAALQAEDWAAANADTQWASGPPGIDIISLSWGIPYDGPSDGSDAYSRGLDACIQRGIQVANAAGNDGPNNAGLTGMSASGMSTIVAALDDLNTIDRSDDIIADYSSRGPRDDNGDGYPCDELKPDISAPGTNINGVVFERVGDGSGGGYGGRGSGTSYAAPYIAGISALLLSINHDLPPLILREVLRATAERRGTPEYPDVDPYWDREFGWGMVDAYNATRVVMEIDDLGAIDVELQAFPTNVTGGNAASPVIDIEGLAWARVGTVAYVEWRVDNGSWERTDIDTTTGAWNVRMGPADLGVGLHTFESRAVGDDARHSVWRPVELNVTTEASGTREAPGGPWVWYAVGLIAVGVAGFYVVRRRPDLVKKALGMLRIRKPAVARPVAQQNP